MRSNATSPLDNAVIILAGGVLLLGGMIGTAIVFVYVTAVVLARRLGSALRNS